MNPTHEKIADKYIIGIDFGINEYTVCRSFEKDGTITLKSVEQVKKTKPLSEKEKEEIVQNLRRKYNCEGQR